MTTRSLADGFEVEGEFFPWGAVQADVLAALPAHLRLSEDDTGSTLGRSEALGLEVLSVRIDAPRPDRPVTGLWLELPHKPVMPWKRVEDTMTARVAKVYGEPALREDHRLVGGDLSGQVCHTAEWALGAVTLGLSVYGSPRREPNGYSGGCVYVTWTDTGAAAEPFLRDLDDAQESLTVALRGAEVIETVTLQTRGYDGTDDGAEPPDPAALALGNMNRLPTPADFPLALGEGQYALWRSPTAWGLSNRRDSVWFPLDELVTVERFEVKPAKGGGHSALQARELSLFDVYGSPAVARMAERIEGEDLAQITLFESYDV